MLNYKSIHTGLEIDAAVSGVSGNTQAINSLALDVIYMSGITGNNITEINEIKQDVNYVSGLTSGNISSINNLNQEVIDLNKGLTGNTKSINDLSDDLTLINNVVTGHTESINTLNQDIIDINQDITSLNNVVTGHTQQISNIKNIMVTGTTSSTDNAIARFDGITGKLIQNSGVVIDDSGNMGFGVTPTAQITQTSTSALESAPLGSELLTSSNWTTTGWTGDFINGFTHTTGNVTPLTNTLAALNNTLYQIAFTVTNRTAGRFTITFGNQTSDTYTSSNAWGVKTTGTGTLSITPTTDFNGTIVISIKRITGTYAPTYQILDSTGISTIEIRSSLNTLNNTFIGKGAGRYNTTGYNNSAQGVAALQNNTTGSNNSAQGTYTLQNNTTGSYNSAQGVNALRYNSTGVQNSAQGASALYSNTTGSYNSAQGYAALYYNTTGYQNSTQGVYALYYNTTGSNNSAQGSSSLYFNTTGNNNTAQGDYALFNNTTGYYNSAQGSGALYSNTTGSYNSAQGLGAGRFLADGVTGNQTSNSSVFLGANTKSKQAGQTNEIVIGANAIGNGSNTATIGHTDVTDTYLRGRVHTNSSMQIGDDTAAASAANEGSIRYRKTANASYAEMVMQTGASTYEWVTIVTKNW